MFTEDEQIKKDIVDSLYWDSRVDASGVIVRVRDKEVVWGGNVPDYSVRQAAEAGTWVIWGVNKVENQITVKS